MIPDGRAARRQKIGVGERRGEAGVCAGGANGSTLGDGVGVGVGDAAGVAAGGADEVHQWRIAPRTIDAYQRDGSTRAATSNLPL